MTYQNYHDRDHVNACNAQEMSKMYHDRAVQTRENFAKGVVSYRSFRYNADQARYWAERARFYLYAYIRAEKQYAEKMSALWDW